MELDFKEIDAAVATSCGFGDHPISLVANTFIPLPDGCNLAAKLWLPFRQDEIETAWFDSKVYKLFGGKGTTRFQPQPVILEYLPYRKDDYTLPRDHQRHPWMCSQGYIIARVDFRGTGDSDDLYWGEYLPQEQIDCCHLLEWLEKQPWCNGRIGMYGKSWGGFNGLEVAYCQPPQLKTAISIYSTDDRYADDIHYNGGCIIASEMLSWSSVMFTWNARPPTPYFVPRWKEEWRHRLEEASVPWVNEWLSHQRRDEFWKHGSICEDPSRVNIPILAIGGWRDCYRDAPFRLATTLPKCRGIIGPWAHEWPDIAQPGPQIDFLNLCLDWWDRFLKNNGDGTLENDPLLTLYLQKGMRPTPQSEYREGGWVTAQEWPTTTGGFSAKKFILNNKNMSLVSEGEMPNITEAEAKTSFSATSGLWHGEYLSFGGPDLAGDQRFADADSLTWTTEPLRSEIGILGNVKLHFCLSVDQESVLIAARLCDVAVDGSSTLITYGVLNLTHKDGHSPEEVKPLVPEEKYSVVLNMVANSYILPKGHRLRVSVATNYWPLIWPSAKPVTATIYTGNEPQKPVLYRTYLELPLYDVTTFDDFPTIAHDVNQPGNNGFMKSFGKPNLPPPIEMTEERKPDFKRTVSFDASGEERIVKVSCDSGRYYIPAMKLITDETENKVYTIREGDPLSAQATVEHDLAMEWPETPEGHVKVRVVTKSKMTADETYFYLENELSTYLDGDVFFEKQWKQKVKRDLV